MATEPAAATCGIWNEGGRDYRCDKDVDTSETALVTLARALSGVLDRMPPDTWAGVGVMMAEMRLALADLPPAVRDRLQETEKA